MRLKVFNAKSVSQAMEQVRAALGDDAVIVHVDQQRGGDVRVTAAVEAAPEPPAPEPQPSYDPFDPAHLAAVLRYHGVPTPLIERLVKAASAHACEDALDGLRLALESQFVCRPLDLGQVKPVMLIGQPGQGKTLAVAKLAAQARLAGKPIQVITLDGAAAGAQAQLEAFCAPLEVKLSLAHDPAELETLAAHPFRGLTLIDSAGVNPYAVPDVEGLARFIGRAKAEPVWVMAAGTDALEAAEMAEIFASLGCRRLIVTRADAARRYAAVLTALSRGRLSLAAVGGSPYLADTLEQAGMLSLAQRFLDKPDPAHLARLKQRA